VVNERAAFVSLHGGRPDSGIWSAMLPNVFYSLSTAPGSGRILAVDAGTLATTVLKDLFADTRFQAAFGIVDRGLSHLRTNSGNPDIVRYAATVFAPSSGLPVGVVVWDTTTDAVWTYKAPDECSQVVPERVRLDGSGQFLKVSLVRPSDDPEACPVENDRSWQSMDLATSAVSDWIRDEAGPWADDAGDNVTYGADGEGVRQWQIFPPQSPSQLVYQLPRKAGLGNEYMEGMACAMAIWNSELVVAYALGHGGLVGPWELYQGNIWRTRWTNEVEDKPYRLAPETVRRGYQDLEMASSLTEMARDRWWFDGQWLYVGLAAGTIPQTEGPEELQAFDWRFGTEEIILVTSFGELKARLCHHHHRQRTATADDPEHPVAACQTMDGTRVTFTTNAGGQDKERVYCVLTSPGDSPYI
jgi:hypothetical protein